MKDLSLKLIYQLKNKRIYEVIHGHLFQPIYCKVFILKIPKFDYIWEVILKYLFSEENNI